MEIASAGTGMGKYETKGLSMKYIGFFKMAITLLSFRATMTMTIQLESELIRLCAFVSARAHHVITGDSV